MAISKKSAWKTVIKPLRALIPPQRLTAAARKRAIEGIPPSAARKIAGSEPVSPRSNLQLRHGRTKKPLAPERVAAILDALGKTYPNVVCALTHRNAFELVIATALSAQDNIGGLTGDAW